MWTSLYLIRIFKVCNLVRDRDSESELMKCIHFALLPVKYCILAPNAQDRWMIRLGGEWCKEQRGRVRGHSNSKYPKCDLRVGRLAESHCVVYQFRFYSSLQISWTSGRSGVTLFVTGTDDRYFSSKLSLVKILADASPLEGRSLSVHI